MKITTAWSLPVLSLATLAILVLCFPSFHDAWSLSSTSVLVPLYDTTGSQWDSVIDAKIAHPMVPIVAIINNGGGPGSIADSQYATLVQRLHSYGISVIGYTYASYGARNSSAIMQDIQNYKDWYGVDGIFIDQMSNTGGDENYYSNLTSYAKSIGLSFVMGNAGTDTKASYVGTVDAIVIYENSQLPSLSYLDGWHSGYDKSNWGILPYGIGSLDQGFVSSATQYVGYIGIGNGTNSTAWEILPPYLGDLVGLLDPVPSSPTGIEVQAFPSEASIQWSIPSHFGSSQITGYQIERNGTVIVNDTMSTSTSFNDTALPTKYNAEYVVAAWNSEGLGHPSGNVSASSANPIETAVTTHNVTVASQDLYGSQIVGFYTELYAENGTQLDAGYTPYNFTLNSGENYTIHVEDYGDYVFDHWLDTGSNNASRTFAATSDNSITAVYMTVPSPPSELAATATSYSQINLSWQAPDRDGGSQVIGYKITRSGDGGSTWTTIVTDTGTTSTAYSDKGLSPNTTYLYHVFAINSIGSSTRSNTASATTLDASYITVTSTNTLGGKITGIWVEIDSPTTGSMIKGGYTTNTFLVNSGKTVVVYASNYQNYVFLHWSDGVTDRYRTVTPYGSMTLTAVYSVL